MPHSKLRLLKREPEQKEKDQRIRSNGSKSISRCHQSCLQVILIAVKEHVKETKKTLQRAHRLGAKA